MSLVVMVMATSLAVGMVGWAGYDFRLLTEAFIGDRGDTLLNSWTIQQALDNLRYRPFDLGYSRAFWGEPAAFGYTIAPYGIALGVLPIYALSGGNLILTYNLYLIATFTLSAWVAYLLIRHLFRPLSLGILPALVAALMIAFCQRRFMHLTHIETLSLQFMLLALYGWHGLISSPRRRWGVLTGVAAAVTLVTSGYLTMMFIVVAAILMLCLWQWRLLDLSPRSPIVRRLVLAAVVAILCAAPFSLYRAGNERFRGGYPIDEVIDYSPSVQSWLTGNSQVYSRPTLNMESAFLGFLPLALTLLGWRWRPSPAATDHVPQPLAATITLTPRQIIVCYALITLTGYFLSLGPVLKWNGAEVMPLPTMLLYQLPGYALMRAPGRFIHLAVIGTAVLGAFALHQMRERLRGTAIRGAYPTLTLLIVVGLLLELLPFNGKFENKISLAGTSSRLVAYPFPDNDDLYAWLRTQPADAAVLHYPMHNQGNLGEYQYLADLGRHPQPMINGWGSWLPVWYWNGEWSTLPNLRGLNFLWQRGVRYLIVHREYITEREYEQFERRRIALQGPTGDLLVPVQRFQSAVVYTLSSEIVPRRFPMDQPLPGQGWDGPMLLDGDFHVWMREPSATLAIAIGEARDYKLVLNVAGEIEQGLIETLTLTINESPVPLTVTRQGPGATIQATIPAALIRGGERTLTTLAFRVAYARTLREIGRSNDDTPRAVLLRSIDLTPQ